MRLKVLVSMIVFLLLATTATALTMEGSCNIRFFGQSTLHDFDGKVACQPFTLASAAETGESGVIRQAVIEVLVGEMDTDNSGRDKKMHAMFEQERYPKIQGLFADLTPEVVLQQLQTSEEIPGHLEFDLRVREISQHVRTTTHDLVVTPERISFVMKFPLALSDFQLKPPSVLGFIKVDDQVQVEVGVLLLRH